MRKLASIQRVTDIRPIPGKDRIVQCHINGWNVIVKKDEFQDGDQAVYIEIDSLLPDKPEFDFLRSKKFRIRTLKLGNTLSEGIAFPLSILPARDKPYELGEDVTEIIGVKKYEPQEDEAMVKAEPRKKSFFEKLPLMRFRWYRQLVGKNKRSRQGFPEEVPKTDEERIQNCPWILDDKNVKWIATEKVDGCSATYLLRRHRRRLLPDTFEFVVCSRNMRLARDNSHYWKVVDRYDIGKVLRSLMDKRDDWVAIQGEVVGPGIQKNKYGLAKHDLYVFNLFFPNPRTKRCIRFDSVTAKDMIEYRGMKFVPILNTNLTLPDTVDETLAMAHGQSVLGDTLREGIVFRSMDGQQSFKAVDPDFLIHYGI